MARDPSPKRGKYADGKLYLVKGRTLNDIMEQIRLSRPVNVRRQTHDGVIMEGQEADSIPEVPGATPVTLSICVDGEVLYLTINGFISITPP